MKILVVDDEFVSLNKLQLLLLEYGECDSATNGEEALEKFYSSYKNNDPYNLITLDIDMPGMKGQEIVEVIREWEKNNEIVEPSKIIMVSAMKDSRNVFTSFQKGCEGYLMKPFNKYKIEEVLSKLDII